MDINGFLSAYDALKNAQNSDEPTTKKEAKSLASALATGIDDLADWAADFEAALADLRQKAEDLADVDSEDRPDSHGEFAGGAEAVIDSLVDLGITPDTIEALRARTHTTR